MMVRVSFSDNLMYELDGMSLDDAIEWLSERRDFIAAYNGIATIDRESGYCDSSDSLNLLIERDETPEETAEREERARAEIRALEARKAAQAKAEYTLYTNLKIKYEGGA